jgi:hypothetical protein
MVRSLNSWLWRRIDDLELKESSAVLRMDSIGPVIVIVGVIVVAFARRHKAPEAQSPASVVYSVKDALAVVYCADGLSLHLATAQRDYRSG